MASVARPPDPLNILWSDPFQGANLPYFELADSDYRQVLSGPRISSCHSQPRTYYGPVTIRNYLAGFTKKSLRVARPKNQPEYENLFLQLPTELKLLVLEQLHPIDLLHFSQSCKTFRSIVMSPKAAGVWKASFELYSDLPLCPPNIAEPKWTWMLFGPGICVECGKHGALTDFAFQKQYCEPCMKTKYAYANSLRDTSNRPVPPDHLVCLMLPRSYRYHGLRYTTAYANLPNAKYMRTDFNAMMKKVTLIQLLIDHQVPFLAELFQDYKVARLIYVQKVQQAAEIANSWATGVFRRCNAEAEGSFRKTVERCKQRLHNLGHEKQDVAFVSISVSQILRMETIHKLSTRTFRKIRPRLEAVVTKRKISRIKAERRELLENIYRDYRKTLDPSSWPYLAPPLLVRDIPGFQPFLTAPYDKRGDMDPGHAVSLFPDFIADWTRKHQSEILGLLKVKDDQDFETRVKDLELATSVIICVQCKWKWQRGLVLIGWESICRHKQLSTYGVFCSDFEISRSASNAVVSLLSCVGLDPATTTVQDMDSRDDRFLCGNCMAETSRGIKGLKAYTWMECLVHHTEMHLWGNVIHETPVWLLLSPEATRFVKENEYEYPLPNLSVWQCNKCSSHFDERVTRAEAIRHAKGVHLIKDPVIGVDVIYDKRLYLRRRKVFRLGMDPPYELRCKRCPDLPIYKLWEMRRLTQHLLSKHKILNPVEGEDWTRINVIAAVSSPISDSL